MKRNAYTGFVARCLALLLAVGVLPAYAPAQPPAPAGDEETTNGPSVLREVGIDQKLNEQVPLDLKFRDETGQVVELGKYFQEGKPVLLTLVYFECPMLCTEVLNGVVRALRVLPDDYTVGEEFEIVTVSFDPRETPPLAAKKKENYLSQYKKPGAAEGWHFLTGDEEAITSLTEAVGFRYVYDERLGQFAHAAAIMLLTPEGKVSRYFYGVDYPPKDLRLGLAEASQGKVGGIAEKILLLCYRYDPTIGRYSLLTLRLVQIGGVITLLSLGTFMFIMFRRDWRKSRAKAEPPGGEGKE